MNTKFVMGSAIASISFMSAALFTPVSADMNFRIHGNGSDSDNRIEVDTSHEMTITQRNDTELDNDVRVINSTGNNSASRNTGTDVEINTGDAEATVEISNMAGANFLEMDGCGCEHEDVDIIVSGNGDDSDNHLELDKDHTVRIDQENNTDSDNDVEVVNSTGGNDVSRNTGSVNDQDYGHNKDKWREYKHEKRDYWKSHKDDIRKQHNSRISYSEWMDMHHTYNWNNYYDWTKHHNSNNNSSSGSNGTVSVDTGDATAHVSIDNAASLNWLSL